MRKAVDRLRDQVLAAARFAQQEDIGLGPRADLDHLPHADHARRTADDHLLQVGRARFARRRRASPCGRVGAVQPGQEREEVLVAEGLGHEVEGPQPHGLDGHGDAAVGGHHDHGHVGHASLLDPLQQVDAVQPRHLQIADHDVELRRLELRPGLLAVGRGNHFMPHGRQIVGQRDAFDFLVVNDQDSHGRGGLDAGTTKSRHEGYSVEELAAKTGMNENTIKVKLFRARQKLVKAAQRLDRAPGLVAG